MDSDQEAEVLSEDPLVAEEEEEKEEEDAKIFNAWMQRYSREREKQPEEEVKEQAEERRADCLHWRRRSSLPCSTTLSTMQLAALQSCSQEAPVTAKTLLRRSSSRRLLPSQEDLVSTAPVAERRPSLIPTIPEGFMPDRKSQFRRRNTRSLSDTDSMCQICHNDLSGGSGGLTELPCTHTFHRECIEERLWKKQSCPTCNVRVLAPQQADDWSSTKVLVP
ncbi:uncharacterized protein LOC133547889 [Nerophis ophidion]|uniref:uncharacterized protein LOC133544226 n=1 Tax=Nerophis ophidion TaxID=159077 RepID=UPI002AE094C3|nr:uncharacterized protein LOC133544226 [Nerophis ophidion]XP_061749357.1 uncharacterized protein LOC133547889 [Nerophis ophidion]